MKYLYLILFLLFSNISYSQTWEQIGGNINGDAADDYFGYGVALSADGKILAVGAANASQDQSKYVKVLQNNNGSWAQLGQTMYAETGWVLQNTFVNAIDISDDGLTVAFSQTKGGSGGNYMRGQVSIYRYSNDAWSLMGDYINPVSASATHNSSFGQSIALSADGNTIIISDSYYGNSASSDLPYVVTYKWNGTAWVIKGNNNLAASLIAFAGGIGDVAISDGGDTVAIIEAYKDGNRGRAYVAKYNDFSGGHDQFNNIVLPVNWYTSRSISLSGDGSVLAVGDDQADSKGQVKVFDLLSGSYTERDLFSGESEDDWFGYHLRLSRDGNRIAVGSVSSSNNVTDDGKVEVFKYNGNTYEQLGEDIIGDKSGDKLGRAVSISADGRTVAGGSIYGNNENGTSTGYVKVFTDNCTYPVLVEGEWKQICGDIDGELEGDNSGHSVSMSNDGTIVAIGAPANDGNGNLAAVHVRVY